MEAYTSVLAIHDTAEKVILVLVHEERLVMIDLPQVVDVIANPRGAWYLTRDAENIGRWFIARGLSGTRPEPADLPGLLRHEARL